jgi:hypothetical protein
VHPCTVADIPTFVLWQDLRLSQWCYWKRKSFGIWVAADVWRIIMPSSSGSDTPGGEALWLLEMQETTHSVTESHLGRLECSSTP